MKDIIAWCWKAAKLVGRFALIFIVSWFIAETLKQQNVIPEHYDLKVWLLTYSIPVRQIFVFGLTGLGGFVDKLLHEWGKEVGKEGWLGTKGLTGF